MASGRLLRHPAHLSSERAYWLSEWAAHRPWAEAAPTFIGREERRLVRFGMVAKGSFEPSNEPL